jgi:hypothetical protein
MPDLITASPVARLGTQWVEFVAAQLGPFLLLPEGQHWALLNSCLPVGSSGTSTAAGLTPVFPGLSDVLASAIPQFQIPKRLREGGQSGALL